MYILGVNISHDGSSCLLQDGEILFYREDERTSKLKHNMKRKDYVLPFIFHHNSSIKHHTNFIDYIIISSFGGQEDMRIIFDILDAIKSANIKWDTVFFNKNYHHEYHAYNAALSSEFEKCSCLIIDGCGAPIEGESTNTYERIFRECESIYSFDRSAGFTKKFKHYSKFADGLYSDFYKKIIDDCVFVKSDSLGCGKLFSTFSENIGYGFNGAGKIMGLASYGNEIKEYGNWFFSIEDIELTNNNLIVPLFKNIQYFNSQKQKDILKTLQEQTKKHTIHLIEKSLKMCNTNNIVLSGGYFLNCVNNYQYLKHFPNVNFYVDPIAHDGGTSIGAAKYLWYNLTKDKTIRKLETLYLS